MIIFLKLLITKRSDKNFKFIVLKKILFVLITLTILVTCKKDAFDEEGEMPGVFYNLETSATEGGSIDKESG